MAMYADRAYETSSLFVQKHTYADNFYHCRLFSIPREFNKLTYSMPPFSLLLTSRDPSKGGLTAREVLYLPKQNKQQHFFVKGSVTDHQMD